MKYFILFIIILLNGTEWVSAASNEDIQIIINAENPATEVSLNELRNYFYKVKHQWPDGERVRFIDRAPGSTVRNIFIRKVLKKSNSDIELFWIGQKLYSGDSAPLREASETATIQFVGSFKGAIGYINSATPIASKNIKTVKITEIEED